MSCKADRMYRTEKISESKLSMLTRYMLVLKYSGQYKLVTPFE